MDENRETARARRGSRRLKLEIALAVGLSAGVLALSWIHAPPPPETGDTAAAAQVSPPTEATPGTAARAEKLIVLARRHLVDHDPVSAARIALAALAEMGNGPSPGRADLHRLLYGAHLGRRELRTLEGHLAYVRAARFSPDGGLIVTASSDETARLWQSRTGALVAELTGHTDKVWDAAFSPDGTQVATASFDGTARLWSLKGDLLKTLKGHAGAVAALAFSPDGRHLVTASHDATARVWDTATGAVVKVLSGHTGEIYHVDVDRNGDRVVTASADGTARLWDRRSGAPIAAFTGHAGAVKTARFDTTGERVVTASADGTARIWRVASGEAAAELKGHTDHVNTARFSADGQRVVTASRDGTARLWDVARGREIVVLGGHGGWVNDARFDADGRRVLTGSGDWRARLWDAKTGDRLAVFGGHQNDVTAVSFSAAGDIALSASADGTARTWHLAGPAALAASPVSGNKTGGSAISPDGRSRLQRVDDRVHVIDAKTGEIRTTLKGHAAAVTVAVFDRTGRRIVTAADDRTARLWDGASGQMLAVFRVSNDALVGAGFSSDGRHVVVRSARGQTRHYRVFTRLDGLITHLEATLPRRLTHRQRRAFALTPPR